MNTNLGVMTPAGPSRLSDIERTARLDIFNLMNIIPADELQMNLGLFMDQRLLSRILFLNFLYKKILPVQGVIMDLGTRWGQSAVLLQTLRSIYEPYNYQRKIIAFDTFAGLSGGSVTDGTMLSDSDGMLSTQPGYDEKLQLLMSAHEQTHPLPQLKKFQIVKGDVRDTVPGYIKQHPETLISLAFFDLDLYAPTKEALQAMQSRLMKGSILVFDELNYEFAPGETQAVVESLDLKQHTVQRFEHCSRVSFIQL